MSSNSLCTERAGSRNSSPEARRQAGLDATARAGVAPVQLQLRRPMREEEPPHLARAAGFSCASSWTTALLIGRDSDEHVSVPGAVIDVEAVINEFRTAAIIDLGPHDIGKAHLFAAQFRERQRQAALPRLVGMGLHPWMVGRGVVRHEVQHQPAAALATTPVQPV